MHSIIEAAIAVAALNLFLLTLGSQKEKAIDADYPATTYIVKYLHIERNDRQLEALKKSELKIE